MKFGLRTPSLKRRIAARTSWKRYVRHSLGFKAPRGWGWVTNPKKAAYNRIYRRTTFSVDDLFKTPKRRSSSGCLVAVLLFALIGFILTKGIWSAVAQVFR
ncbi:MAG: hypothetical protein ACLPT4_02560 [Verrucomicrobiia bacterium]